MTGERRSKARAGDVEIVDAHAHVHPTSDAAHAFLAVTSQEQRPDGTAEESIRVMEQAGIAKTLILPWVFGRQMYDERLAGSAREAAAFRETIAVRCSTYNRWAIRIAKERPVRFAALCAVDPVLFGEAWARREIDECIALGAIGLKIVPSFIKAYPNDQRMAVVWEEAQRRRLPVLSQCGGQSRDAFAHPAHFEEALAAYPDATLVFAHVGMGAEEEVARLTARYANLYTDTSYWLGKVGRPGGPTLSEAAELFRRIGIDRVLFGTNYPICDPVEFVEVFRAMPFSDAERRQISFENYRRVYEAGSADS
ncbi:MAG: amidohydrolase family protein [Chloroflexi bacterium]|nr:amidohydrolase family protein [Chloroflexota bacterium]